MRKKSTTTLKYFIILIGLCIAWFAGFSKNVTGEPVLKNLSDFPKFFHTDKDIKSTFEKRDVPVDLSMVQGTTQSYCFALAYPYSGVDTTELYCFVKCDTGWIRFLTASLWKTPNGTEFKVDGDFVDVVCKGKIVLKIDPPR